MIDNPIVIHIKGMWACEQISTRTHVHTLYTGNLSYKPLMVTCEPVILLGRVQRKP